MKRDGRRSGNGVLKITAMGVAAAVLLLAFAGCHSKTDATNENFMQSLNAYFMTHNECLFESAVRFPFETYDSDMARKMDALVNAQLLKLQEEKSIHANRYTTTLAGAQAAPKFCYGHREVTSIDSFTPPAKAHGFPETEVMYHFAMKDVPVWARTPQVMKAFPAMAEQISGQTSAKATLAQTMAGWQVPE